MSYSFIEFIQIKNVSGGTLEVTSSIPETTKSITQTLPDGETIVSIGDKSLGETWTFRKIAEGKD